MLTRPSRPWPELWHPNARQAATFCFKQQHWQKQELLRGCDQPSQCFKQTGTNITARPCSRMSVTLMSWQIFDLMQDVNVIDVI